MEIPAVHDKDLRTILEKKGLADKIDNGELRCNKCNELLTWDNIAVMQVVKEQLIIFCDDPTCLESVINK